MFLPSSIITHLNKCLFSLSLCQLARVDLGQLLMLPMRCFLLESCHWFNINIILLSWLSICWYFGEMSTYGNIFLTPFYPTCHSIFLLIISWYPTSKALFFVSIYPILLFFFFFFFFFLLFFTWIFSFFTCIVSSVFTRNS